MKNIIAVASMMSALSANAMMPKGKPQRIVGYYNPETDKEQERNSSCNCGSGKKYKKCCIIQRKGA